MSSLPRASAGLSKLGILCLNDLLGGDLCMISFIFIYFLFFLFLNIILSDPLILPVSQLETQQVMTSQN